MSVSRETTLSALELWQRGEGYVSESVTAESERRNLAGRDRGHALHLALGIARNLDLLDFWIDHLRNGELQPRVRDILRLGLFECLLGDAAPHAAVNEAVSLCRKGPKGLVNAILRRSLREKEALLADAEAAGPAIRYSHPPFLLERWRDQFGEETALELVRWNQDTPPLYARANPLRVKAEAHLNEVGRPVPGAEGFYEVPHLPWQEINDGEAYMQDPSTRLAVELLSAQPGERILDACAAPGGKAAFLAGQMKNEGLLVAAESDPDRLERLLGNLSRLGVTCAQTQLVDWNHHPLPAEMEEHAPFDAILLDVPCSNTGVMQRRVEVRHRLHPEDFETLRPLQARLLDAVAPLLKPGGRLLYSTCSLDREENEEQVAAFLGRHKGWTLEKEGASLPWRDGFDGAYAAKLVRGAS